MPGELTPNYVGMMAMLCFIGACGVRSLVGAFALSALPLYVIIVMESRDSILSAAIAGLIIIGYRVWRLGWKKLRPFVALGLLGGPIACISLYFVGIDLFGHAYNAFENLFMFNDAHRGINSGASGRVDLWNAAFNLWQTHPLFGVGFKGQQQMMPDQALSHNAYLGVLAEVGLVGFVGYMLIVGTALYRTLKLGARGLSHYPQRVAILISYLVYGMLESRAFSFGNSYSLVFLLVAFDSSKLSLNVRAFVPWRASQLDISPPDVVLAEGQRLH
jgi:O-antigen ligase